MIEQLLNSTVLQHLWGLAKEYYVGYAVIMLITLNFTWVWFTAIMRLQEMREAGVLDVKRNRTLWYLAWFNLLIGLMADAFLAVLLAIPLLDFPRWWKGEFLTTAFLSRHYNEKPAFEVFKLWMPLYNADQWYSMHVRKPFATWAGAVLLDDIDPSGKHIK